VISSFGRAARGASVGRVGDMALAVVDHNGRLGVVLADGTVVTLSLESKPDGSANLVCESPLGRTVLATGGLGQMEDLRKTVAAEARRSARRGRGFPVGGAFVAGAAATALAAIFLLAPAPIGPALPTDALARMASQMQAPQSIDYGTSAATRAGAGGQPATSQLSDGPSPAVRGAVRVPRIDQVPADGPVSLDDAAPSRPPVAAPQASAQQQPLGIHQQSAAAQHAATGSVESDPRIVALREAIQTLRDGGKVKAATLKLLPPALAQQVIQSGHAEVDKIPAEALRSAGHDPYGTPDVPEDGTWAALGADQVPLPGGGDIKTPDDMRSFGFDPGNVAKK
jgi:hypothetical protein